MFRRIKVALIGLILFTILGSLNSRLGSVSAQSNPSSSMSQQQELVFRWDGIAQFATTLGVLISAASIVASYRLYQMSKRDEYVSNLRTSILLTQERCTRLQSLVNYELINEIVNCVVYSRDLELPLLDIFNCFFKSNTATEDELRTYMHSMKFPFISTPIHSDIISLFDNLTVMISSDLARYQVDAPGFHRVMSSLRDLYLIIEANTKNLIRSEEKWILYLTYLFRNMKNEIQNVRMLKHHLSVVFITEIHNSYIVRTGKDINDLSQIAHIVSQAYLSLNEPELFKFSRIEKKENLKPVSDRIPDNLKEAEKTLKDLLKPDHLHKYWELMARFEERNESENT